LGPYLFVVMSVMQQQAAAKRLEVNTSV